MKFESQKLELINWIFKLKKVGIIKKLMELKVEEDTQQIRKKRFGYGVLGGEVWMSDDFDATPEDFKDYMP